ncbi:hypothetical protein CC86DRAFT_32067 [Ophiobolus disseminans]|uniref:Uncharacterized protein n=1 Tax=Ophiobolus disseminans TaxID=1469910 RepID=A0A6A7A103_9PLEO|nr:hypothetical protein CC86DRAFT_32067 [Ophiobolus disseminans]
MPRPSIPNGWGNFFVHIKQDDVVMQVKAKEDYKRQGGDTFRPEMKETYKDQRGKKETKVHEKVGGRTGGKSGTARDDQRDVRKEESPEGGVRLEHGLISDELVRAD